MAKTSSRSNIPDISGLDLDELRELRQILDARMTELEEEHHRDVYHKIQELATGADTTIEKLLVQYGGGGRRTPGRVGKKIGAREAKYRNPANPDQTWSGKGRQPDWFKKATAAGKRPEDLAV